MANDAGSAGVELDVHELRRHRIAKGLTQEQLAELLKVSASAVSDWENGYRKPHPKTFKLLAEKLGVEALSLTRVISPDPVKVGIAN